MAKKILLGLAAVLVVAGGVAALSAYEAHIINVTAHIENALYVHNKLIPFGTVFPEESVTRNFMVEMSNSFRSEPNAYDISYKIVQKPKCWDKATHKLYAPVNYWDEKCPEGYEPMPSLCPFLSKLPVEEEQGDVGVTSYYVVDKPDYCVERTGQEIAYGVLNKKAQDYVDEWTIDLKVPPFKGYVGQDWPASCPVIKEGNPETGSDFGCDLWVEVTGVSRGAQ